MKETQLRELAEIRKELDEVDASIVSLFEKRMNLCREVAAAKMAAGIPVLDQSREAQVLASRAAQLRDASLADGVKELYTALMAISRAEQQKMMLEAAHDA